MPIDKNGIEKRFINGREIIIKPKDSIDLQKDFDSRLLDLPGEVKDLRSSFDVSKISKEDLVSLGDAFGKDSFFNHSQLVQTTAERDKQRFYQIYREMFNQTFIKNALDIIKNETAQKNVEGNLLTITSDNQDVVDDGNELFFDILDINYELKSIITETCQMGDNYYEMILDNYEKPETIVHMEYIKPEKITIIRQNGRIKYYLYINSNEEGTEKKQSNFDPNNFFNIGAEERTNVKVLMPWQVVHFKIKDKQSDPYGRSLFKGGIKDYRRLTLLEDSMLVYRISRAPERRVFYIDVGQLNSADAHIFLNKIKNTFKKEPIVDEYGNLSEKANVMSLMEDYYIPVREGSQGTRIETLPAGQQLNEIKDVDYFKDKVLRLLNIPSSYIGGSPDEAGMDASKALSNLDIKFSNYIEEIQSFIVKGLNKILSLQLILKKYKSDEIINYKISLTPPSNLNELIKLDYLNQQMSVASLYKQSMMFSDEYIYKNIFKMSDREMYREKSLLAIQMQSQASQQMMGGAGVSPGMEAGGLPAPGMDAGGMPPEGGVVPPEAGGMPPAEGQPPMQVASFNPEIYKMGLKMFYENGFDEFVINNMIEKMGNGYLIENKGQLKELLLELKTLRGLFTGEDNNIKKENKKRNRNDFKSMVRLGEFNGIDFDKNVIKYFKDGVFEKDGESVINLDGVEGFED